MNTDPLPAVPVPAPPVNPECDWCGDRPASPYEVEPAVMTTKVTKVGEVEKRARVVKGRAIIAYACTRHRELFDRQKAEKAHGKVA